jgi:pectate lyase/pectin methylesterase-like acyl-CoA thioesterase
MMKAIRIMLCLLLLAAYVPLAGTTRAYAAELPAGWSSIGYNNSGGSAAFDGTTGLFSIATTGVGITNQGSEAEQFQYAYTPVNGDFTLITKLDSFPYVSGAQAGILVRGTLSQGSPFVYGYLYGTGSQYQPYVSTKAAAGTGAASNSGYKVDGLNKTYDFAGAPKYMRVRKQWNVAGSKTDVYYDLGASDGTTITWTNINGKSITDPAVASSSTMYVGLAIGKSSAASFGSVTLINAYTTSMSTEESSLTRQPAHYPPPQPAVTAPTGVAAAGGNAKVDLSWNTVTGATYYSVKRSRNTTGGAPYAIIADNLTFASSVTSATYTDLQVTNGAAYYYVVSASAASGESASSIEVSAVPAAPAVPTTPPAPATLPAAPANVSAQAGDGQLIISWSGVSGAVSYNVKRSSAADGAYTTLASPVTGTSFTDTGLTNGMAYYYKVSAVNAVGEGPDSAAAAGKPAVYILNDNFESRALGLIPPGYTSLLEQSAINNLTVVNTKDTASRTNSWYTPSEVLPASNISPEIAGNSTNVLWVNDNANSGRRGSMVYSFSPVTGNKGITAQLDFMQPKVIGDSYALELVDSSNKTALTLNVGASPVKIEANQWYTVKYVADVNANTADLYINGVYQGNMKFSNPVTNISKIQSRTAGSSLGSMYLDHLTVYEQNVTTPQNLKAEGANQRAELSWNAAAGVEAYNVYRSDTSGGAYTLIASGVPVNSYSDTNGLVNDRNYYYKVTAAGSAGESDFSNEARAFPNNVAPPSAEITGFKAVVRDSQLTLTWGAVPEATVYTLQRSTTPNGPFVPLTMAGSPKLTAASYLDTNLTNGTEYYYVLTAGNIGGPGSTGMLEKVSPAAPLGAPILISAVPGSNKVDLNWTPIPNAARYTVSRSTVNGGSYEALAAVDGTAYTDATAVNGTSYYYVVTAVNEVQSGMISNQLKAKPYAAAEGAPVKPAGLKASANEGSVSLAWDPVSGAASYSVKRATVSGGPYTSLTTTGQTSFEDTGVTNGTTYYYVAAAVNESGEGPESDEIAVLPAKVLTVDKNAPADGIKVFNTIQSAVNKVPTNNAERTVIYITPGTYTEKLTVNSPYVSLVGAGMDVTSIVYGDYAGTSVTQGKPGHTGNTFLSQTVAVAADYFTAANLTIENSSGPRSEVAQAVALSLKSDMAVLESVKLIGYQDTLYNGLNPSGQGRQYFRDSIIQGDVDFIFGEAPAVVMDNVKMVLVSNSGGGGHITAGAQKNTTDKGYVFFNSQIVDDSSASGIYDLGRAWKDYARVSFINTFINSKKFLEGGWATSCAGTCKQSYFSEYNSYGPGANPSARQISTQLSGAEASLTIPQIMNGWDPSAAVILPMVRELPAVVAAASSFDKNNQADIHMTVQFNGYALTGLANGTAALGASDYTVNGNVVAISKSYLAGLPVGTVTLEFNFGTASVPVMVSIIDSNAADIGRQVLAVNDGWGSFTTGTKGGSSADSSQTYVVTKRSELIAALGGANSAANSTPKIIYIKGTIDMNVDGQDNPVGMEYYAAPGYDFDAYLAAYDPAVWGRASVPTGPLETARAASNKNQGDNIKINVGSNTTIVGLPGSNAKIRGGSLMIQNVDNVIVRNIEFENTFDYFPQWDPTDGDSGNWNSAFDSVTIKGSTHIWVDHNTFSDVGGLDDPNHKYYGRKYQQHDGALDMTNASDLITVSYNYFHDHDKTTLIGGSDSFTGDAGKERITFHHNYYKNVGQRAPRVRFGQVHAYNNYYEGTMSHPNNPFLYAIGVGFESQVYAESNYFANDAGLLPSSLIQVSAGTAFTDEGTILNGTPVDISSGHSSLQPVGWTPRLFISMDKTVDVPQSVKSRAGTFGTDLAEPVWTAGSTMSASNVGKTSLTLSWTAAADYAGVAGYKLYTVTGSTYTEIAALGEVNTYNVTDLAKNTAYTFTIKAVDAAGNWSSYGPSVTAATDHDNRDNNPSTITGNTPDQKEDKPGEVDMTGAVKASVADGVVTAVIDASKAAELVSKASAEIKLFQVEVHETGRVVKVELTSGVLQAITGKNPEAVLKIKSEIGTYSLPAKLIDTAAIAKQMGLAEEDLRMTVTMEKVEGEKAAGIEAAVRELGAKTLTAPVDFNLVIESADGRKQEISTFSTFVERTIRLQVEVNPKTAAGVMYIPDKGQFMPVPTLFNGREATMLRRGNSIYTVIDHQKTFSDLSGHWAKEEVETLAGKLIVNGVTESEFAPQQKITRAEFAALLVRALGLSEEQTGGFSDVAAIDWFSGAAGAAKRAGLIDGFEDGAFRPAAVITREQMVMMIVRALKLGGQEVKADMERLEKFADRSDISNWSADAVAVSLAAGIVEGTSDTTFAARDHATRAESAAMLKRLLQVLKFMN